MTEHRPDQLDAVIAEGFLSADCHVFEPRDLFHRRMQKKFRDRAPGMISKSDSDYPHTEGTFPNSRDTVRRIFAGVPADEVKKMVSTNAASLFGFDA